MRGTLIGRPFALGLLVGGIVFPFLPAKAEAQVVVKVNDNINFRFGALFQGWADWTQDPISEGYSENMLIRRIRFILLVTVAPGVSAFYQTDNPRLGNASTTGNKNINTGFLTQDAFVEWKLAGDALMLEGGLFLVPTSRNGLTGAPSFLAFEIGTWARQNNTIMKASGGRDIGVGLKGYLVGNHLEYRAAVFDGNRNPAPLGPAAGSRNSFRAAGRVNYDLLDVEKGYSYAGTNRGTRRILAMGAWVDGQGAYRAYGGDFIIDWPISKDAITAEFDYQHFEGGNDFPALAKQDNIYTNGGYYFDSIKVQPFIRYERLNFSNAVDRPKGQERYAAGFNWYVSGQNLKISTFYERIMPRVKLATAATQATNHFVIQLQAFYF